MIARPFNPQLRAARFLPRTVITARTLPALRVLTKLAAIVRRPDAQVVSVDANVSVHVFRPASARPQSPALLTKERGEIRPVLQLLSYPMLDDRTTTRTDIDPRGLRLWSPASNRFGWRAYLGPAITDGDAPPLAAPARYHDLSGLPPAWIGVGSNDLFRDEDVTYARRLQQAGVASTLHVVPGAYHNFDSIEAKAAISRAFVKAQTTALDEALNAG
jgi:hypothetical protein